MTIYVSKVWGFYSPCGPLVFGKEGWRNRAINILKHGDRVILVGTLGPETMEADRNRVLGMMEPSAVKASTSDFAPMQENDRRLYKEDGSFRWPYALINLNAWEFEPGLFLKDVARERATRLARRRLLGWSRLPMMKARGF